MSIDDLRAAVETQATARARGDDATFASYLAPPAILQLGAAALPAHKPRRYEIIDVTGEDEASGASDVAYSGGGWRYVVRTRWQLRDGHWRGTAAEVLPGTLKPSWWRRLLPLASSAPEPAPPRRDLS